MLDQSLFELAIATCFSSNSLARNLKVHLLQSPASDLMDKGRFEAACLQVLKDDLDADYARRFRLGDIAHALEVVWPRGVFSTGHLPCLDHLFRALMQEHGDYLQYQDGQEQAYARMSARLDPALMATWRIAQRVAAVPSLDAYDLQRIVACQQPFFSPLPGKNSAVADNHVHVGGVHYDGLVLMAGLLDLNTSANAPDADRLALAELQRLAQALLARGNWLPCCKTEEIAPLALSGLLRKTLGGQWQTQVPEFLDWHTVADEIVDANPREPRWLRQQIARSFSDANIAKAWHWFLIWLWTHYQHEECPGLLRITIFYLLNSLMVLRRKIIMDGPGLSRFVQYYSRDLRDSNVHFSSINAAGTLFQNAEDVAELKVTQGKFGPQAIATWLGQLAKSSGIQAPNGLMPLSGAKAGNYRAMMERWHYCIHFVRSPGFQNNPQAVWKEAKTLLDNMDKQAGWDRPELLGPGSRAADTADHPRLIPSRWVRGLDVAGDENLVRIETYAPALRWIRQGMRRKFRTEPASRGPHLSVHAGEDYGHPLSGMRHLDETVQFCEMKAGDRLGHALALGIIPADWLAQHGEMVIPVDEHVDNLVWAWHYAGLMSEHLPLAAQVMPMLERRIRLMLPFVPWTHPACIGMASINMHHTGKKNCASAERIAQLHPEVLFKAWQLRRNCSFQLQQWDTSKVSDDLTAAALPDIKILSEVCENELSGAIHKPEYFPAVKLFRTRSNWLSQQKGGKTAPKLVCEKNAGIRKVKISLNTSTRMDSNWQRQVTDNMDLLEDHHSAQELEFMHALQDWLLDSYDQKGLLIETNPTSNVYIARLNKHADHPVFRWYPIDDASLKSGEVNNKFGLRRGPIKVCINTDDPGIMPTTLRTEYALLREAAIEHKATRTAAEAWLERIRQIGLNEFDKNHQPVWINK